MLSFKPTFSLSSFTFIQKLFSSSIVCYSQINPFVWLKITSVLLFKVNTSEPIQKSESSLMHMIISVTYIIDLEYCDNEWFLLETNTDHSVIFEIASKYCISDSLVMDYINCYLNGKKSHLVMMYNYLYTLLNLIH